MSVSRFYSLALGKFRNFQTKTDGLIAQADSSPDVSLNSLLYANNSSTVVIQHFDGGEEGQVVHLVNLGSDLSFNGTQLKLADSSNLTQNDNISFVYSNSSWYELSRSHSASLDIITASQANTAPSVKNAKTLIVANSSTVTITNFANGYEGQQISVLCYGSSFVLDTATSTNIVNVGSAGNYAVLSNSTIRLTRYKSKWWTDVEPKT